MTKRHWLWGKEFGGKGKPDRFWSTLTEAEIDEFFKNDGCLTGELKERFCRFHDIHDPPPGPIQIQVRLSDVDRIIREQNK